MIQENLVEQHLQMDLLNKNLEKNTTFSQLYLEIIKKLCAHDENEKIVHKFLKDIFEMVAVQIRSGKPEDVFINQQNGHRLIKGVI